MNYFQNEENVSAYIKMSAKYDGRDLIPKLLENLPEGSSLLELGMGPGKDMDLLNAHYEVTGSDTSPVFLERYRKTHPTADLLQLDAVTIETERIFSGIYSNKVLIHLTKEELKKSFSRQVEIIKKEGIAFHTFWRGDREEEFDGLRFVYYTPETIKPLIDRRFEIIESAIYKESAKNDSFNIILKRI